MSEVRLTGLLGHHPLGALAAFGLLRCCEGLPAYRGSRLGWWHEGDWFAILETPKAATPEELVQALVERQKGRPASPELSWARSLKAPLEDFQAALAAADEQLLQGERDFADFLAAFACELHTDDQGVMEPTAFYMTSGRQQFLDEAGKLARKLDQGVRVGRRTKPPAALFTEALFGPWKYEDPQHSLGWDPATERLHALRARSPTKEDSKGVVAAVWLAFEALPLFPCFHCGGRLRITGFQTHGRVRKERMTSFTWPIWTAPISLRSLRSLLALPELTQDEPPAGSLRARGVEMVFRSERYKVKTEGPTTTALRGSWPGLGNVVE